MGNAGIKDSAGRTVLAKPERDSVKKIDGVVASVMAVAGLLGSTSAVHTQCAVRVLTEEWDDGE